MENKKIIKLDRDGAMEFVQAADRCNFDIDIFYNRVIIDAKSILGVLSLDLSQNLTVRYAGVDENFENVLNKFQVA
jgi:phosphotransferase system HPr-like phosphotransfer protein